MDALTALNTNATIIWGIDKEGKIRSLLDLENSQHACFGI